VKRQLSVYTSGNSHGCSWLGIARGGRTERTTHLNSEHQTFPTTHGRQMLHVARSLGVGLHASRAANVLWQTESLRRRGGLTASSRPWPQQQLCAYSSKSGWGDDDPPWTGSALVDSLLMCAWITCAVHTFDQYGFSSIWVSTPSPPAVVR
jgi:hypothetical protein